MTDHLDPRSSWIRQRIYELQQSGMKYSAARAQAEAEADVEFSQENGDNGNGATG